MSTPDDLPLDPDAAPRAAHRDPRLILLVLVGGAAGTALRHATSDAVDPWHHVPVATLVVNVVGAFVLGVLLESLVRRGPDVGRRRALRLLLGTGFCGGLTTFSSLAVDADTLLRGDHVALGVAYALATLLVGGLATWAGIVVGARTSDRETR